MVPESCKSKKEHFGEENYDYLIKLNKHKPVTTSNLSKQYSKIWAKLNLNEIKQSIIHKHQSG